MRRLSCGILVCTILACAPSANEAAAQAGPPAGGSGFGFGEAPRSGPVPKAPAGVGGTISGRINLIGPSETATAPPALAAPAAPAPIFSPQRLDTLDPSALGGLKLHAPAPNARATTTPAKPVAPAPAAPTPKPVEAALTPAVAPVAPVKQRLTLSAAFSENGPRVQSGVKWRLFTDQADANGEHMLVAESTDAVPHFDVDPGAYIVHAVYGLVSAAKFVQVKPGAPTEQSVVLSAGAVRIAAFAGSRPASADDVTFKLTREVDGVTRTVADQVKPGTTLRLPAGRYHVTSLFGDANAAVEADLTVAAGKFVEAQIHHKAAKVSLKLVQQPGGPDLRDTSWTVLTPGGDVIRDSIGALDDLVLAEGDYTAIARRDGQLYQQSFAVKAGVDAKIEVILR
ncbi:hypothetical protein IHQ68_00015 [Chelatococcus sambhunathii]|uniref:Uncharacterized protein n=1 Tax=Chelatococcus sambhunathii TaxID=363953 RepID=A0ABU1DAA9_9HYPH|nr:hypothetical protein [Chelatococcus sambhunathii]MDR4305012.1 hypothetical protein [Chelatococcus sambhunathii]